MVNLVIAVFIVMAISEFSELCIILMFRNKKLIDQQIDQFDFDLDCCVDLTNPIEVELLNFIPEV